MNALYLDLRSGVSGDMFLGALLDLGVGVTEVEHQLRGLPVYGWHLHVARAMRSGVAGTKVDVHVSETCHPDGHDATGGHANEHQPTEMGHLPVNAGEHGYTPTVRQPHRDAKTIRSLIMSSPCSPWVKEHSISVFQRIAEAEAKIHGCCPDDVHFHEVGAVDSIVDIVGSCIALEIIGRPKVLASEVTDGCGWVECAHGRYPVPVPATIEILAARKIPIRQCGEPHELVTPTGAALVAEFADSFGPIPLMRVQRVGYGIGARELAGRPNVLRALLGEVVAEVESPQRDWETDTVAVLETNLDDITPEMLGHFAEQMFGAGALDVFFTPVQMKKNRPGVLLGLICAADRADEFTEKIMRQTSAFGVRRTLCERRKLRREFRTVVTQFGDITVKLGLLNGEIIHVAPEYESCKEAASKTGARLADVYDAARRCFSNEGSQEKH